MSQDLNTYRYATLTHIFIFMHIYRHAFICMHTLIYAHIKRGHSHIREISLSIESLCHKLDEICFAICLTNYLLKMFFHFMFMHITDKCFIRKNSSLKNRFLLFGIV